MKFTLKFRSFWDDMLSSLWFRPTLFTVTGAILAVICLYLDQHIKLDSLPFLNPGVDDARSILTSITSSMLTVTSVTFSTIMVALVLASQQFSPRILRNFMRDSASQNVLGVFIGTFFFSLLVLGRVTDTKQTIFVPTISLLMSIVLLALSIGMLIFFIHHIAEHIQVTNIVSNISSKTIDLLDERFPEKVGKSPAQVEEDPSEPVGEPQPLWVDEAGYIQAIDAEALLKVANQHQVVVRLERSIGDFVPYQSVIGGVWSAQPISDELRHDFKECYDMGSERTFFEDILFGLRQMVDIAAKALSPGVNDPTTAGNCIDRIMDVIVRAAGRSDPSCFRYSNQGELRVIVRGSSFNEMMDMGFNQIRQFGKNDVSVTLRLLEALAEIAAATDMHERHTTLWRHAGMISRAVDRNIEEPFDRSAINQRIKILAQRIGKSPSSLLLSVDEDIIQEFL